MKPLIGVLIEARGLKKGYIADKLGITRQQLSNWIAGRSFPTIHKAFQLADILSVKVDNLYERSGPDNVQH